MNKPAPTASASPEIPVAVWSRFAAPLPDMRKRADLVAFLVNHDRHCDYLDPFRFSNDVKLWNLDLGRWDGETCMKARAALDYLIESADDPYTPLFEDFQDAHGACSVGFGGRSGGHIVLYGEAQADLSPDDLTALSMPELRRLVRLVHDFDVLCDACVASFAALALALALNSDKE